MYTGVSDISGADNGEFMTDTVDICGQNRYPINDDVKVRNFGDICKVTLEDGVATFAYRANFQPAQLSLDDLAQ